LNHTDVVDAFRFHSPPAWVISNGRVIDPASLKAHVEMCDNQR
jgi:hypothetical protein